MNWEEKITEPKEKAVFAALANPEWDFRTVQGIAAETHLAEDEVRQIIERHADLVRKAEVLDKRGRELFTLGSRPVSVQEKLAALRAFFTKSPR